MTKTKAVLTINAFNRTATITAGQKPPHERGTQWVQFRGCLHGERKILVLGRS